MEKRLFGRTGIQLSVLGFGCGAVGGMMVHGRPLDQERTIARAIAAGVNYFALTYFDSSRHYASLPPSQNDMSIRGTCSRSQSSADWTIAKGRHTSHDALENN
jgi:hypothetical protein